MNTYSEDLRKKIVGAVERGTPKIEAARAFGVGISSLKRHAATYRERRSPAPKKRPGSELKMDETARRLLEEDLEEPTGGYPPPQTRVPTAGMRGLSRRLHGLADAQERLGGAENGRWDRANAMSGRERPGGLRSRAKPGSRRQAPGLRG